MPQKKIIFWITNPRSISTSMVQHMLARKDGTVVMQEPGIFAFNKHVSTTTDVTLTKNLFVGGIPTFEGVQQKIGEIAEENPVFVKEMAFAAKHYLNKDASFVTSENTYFFISLRDPADSIVSNCKILKCPIEDNLRDTWSHKELLELHERLLSFNKNTFLMDSHQVIEDPEAFIQHFCQRSEINYIPKSMRWQPLNGVRQVSTYCRFVKEWQDTAAESSGFDKTLITPAKRNNNGEVTFEEIPEQHRQAYLDYYKEQLPFYQQLMKMCHQANAKNTKAKI